MDFKALSLKLFQPYWNTRPFTHYMLKHPESGAYSGPGVWFARSTPEDRRLWNLSWGACPALDAPAGMTWQTATVFTANLGVLRKVGEIPLKVPGLGGGAYFTVLELSNLLSMAEFYPFLLQAKQRGQIPAWVRTGLHARLKEHIR